MDSNQILHNDNDLQVLSMGGPRSRFMHLIGRIAIFLQVMTNINEIWHDDTSGIYASDQQLKFPELKIQHGRLLPA